MAPTLNSDSGREGESSRLCVQLGAKAENVLGQFDLVNAPAQLVYQTLNRTANASHRTMERAGIYPNFDHEKATTLPDINPSVGPQA